MENKPQVLQFNATLLKPKNSAEDFVAFVVIPKEISQVFPRRGRTGADIHVNQYTFQAILEPDGQLSHWLKIDHQTFASAKLAFAEHYIFEITPVLEQPEPVVPDDFDQALANCIGARQVWLDTTTIARIDWIHWIESAKQAKTRAKRIADACNMLKEGKSRVCCFDTSGFYSKVFKLPACVDSKSIK